MRFSTPMRWPRRTRVPQYVIQDEFLHFDMQVEPNDEGRVYDSASGMMIGDLAYPGAERLKKPVRGAHLLRHQPVARLGLVDGLQFRPAFPRLDHRHAGGRAEPDGGGGRPHARDAGLHRLAGRRRRPSSTRPRTAAEFVADHLAKLNTSELVDRYSDRERDLPHDAVVKSASVSSDSHQRPAAISPFVQRTVMRILLTGIPSYLQRTVASVSGTTVTTGPISTTSDQEGPDRPGQEDRQYRQLPDRRRGGREPARP